MYPLCASVLVFGVGLGRPGGGGPRPAGTVLLLYLYIQYLCFYLQGVSAFVGWRRGSSERAGGQTARLSCLDYITMSRRANLFFKGGTDTALLAARKTSGKQRTDCCCARKCACTKYVPSNSCRSPCTLEGGQRKGARGRAHSPRVRGKQFRILAVLLCSLDGIPAYAADGSARKNAAGGPLYCIVLCSQRLRHVVSVIKCALVCARDGMALWQ